MTRRTFFWTSIAMARPAPLVVPVRRVMDSRARCTPRQFHQWWNVIWPEAFRDFNRGGILLNTVDAPGEIKRTASSRPLFTGLERGVINLVLTDHIPQDY